MLEKERAQGIGRGIGGECGRNEARPSRRNAAECPMQREIRLVSRTLLGALIFPPLPFANIVATNTSTRTVLFFSSHNRDVGVWGRPSERRNGQCPAEGLLWSGKRLRKGKVEEAESMSSLRFVVSV